MWTRHYHWTVNDSFSLWFRHMRRSRKASHFQMMKISCFDGNQKFNRIRWSLLTISNALHFGGQWTIKFEKSNRNICSSENYSMEKIEIEQQLSQRSMALAEVNFDVCFFSRFFPVFERGDDRINFERVKWIELVQVERILWHRRRRNEKRMRNLIRDSDRIKTDDERERSGKKNIIAESDENESNIDNNVTNECVTATQFQFFEFSTKSSWADSTLRDAFTQSINELKSNFQFW